MANSLFSAEFWLGKPQEEVQIPTSIPQIDLSNAITAPEALDINKYDAYNQLFQQQVAQQLNLQNQIAQQQAGQNLLNRGVAASGISGLQQAQLSQNTTRLMSKYLTDLLMKETEQQMAARTAEEQFNRQVRANIGSELLRQQFQANAAAAAPQEGALPGLLQGAANIAAAYIAHVPPAAPQQTQQQTAPAATSTYAPTQMPQLNTSALPTGNLGGYSYTPAVNSSIPKLNITPYDTGTANPYEDFTRAQTKLLEDTSGTRIQLGATNSSPYAPLYYKPKKNQRR